MAAAAAATTSSPSASTSPSTSRPSSAAATTSVVQLGAEADTPLAIDGRSHPSLLAIGRLVGRRLRVTVADGRVLSGILSCLDPQGNLVLSDTLTLGGLAGGGGGGGKDEEKQREEAEAATTTTTSTTATTTAEAHAPLSLDDGHHHPSRASQSQQQQQQQSQQDHAMGMVIVPRARRVRCCVEVESFEVERVSAEVERAMES